MDYGQGKTDKIVDFDFKNLSEPNTRQDEFWKGRTVFLLNSPPPSRRYLTKGPPPGVPTPASEDVNTEQVQDTEVTEDASLKSRKRHTEELRCSLDEDVIGKKLTAELLSCTAWNSSYLRVKLTELFFVPDPTTGEQRTGDYWFQLPIAWVRFHYQLRNALYEPDFIDGGPTEDQLGSLRWTVFVKSPDRPKSDGMTYCNWWREEDQKTDQYEVGLDVGHSWIGYTIFEPAPLENFTEEPEQETFDVTARKPKALTSPLEPTQQERELHNLTHLPYRSWCEICVKAKGKETPSRRNFGQTTGHPS